MIKTVTQLKCLIAMAALTAVIFSACSKNKKKDDEMGSGGAAIQFTTNKSFGGKNEFKSTSSGQSTVVRVDNINRTQITFNCVQADLPQLSTVTLTFFVPKGATTADGSLTGKFENGSTASTQGQLLIGSSNAGSSQESYSSSTGNFTITKLTDKEIEGTFDAYCENNSSNTNISLSNGKFSGKF